MVDGPHGVREGADAVHFPNMCCIGASWDRAKLQKMGDALADECIHFGTDMLLAPGMNIKRYILCGRNFEYISEDPVLSGEMAASYINGLQSKGIGGCLKHFAANNQELNRLTLNAEIDERTLREIYLKGFEIAVKKSRPEGIMCSYNKLNAIWCSENRFLLTQILRDEWGFDGFVVSDWGAVHDPCRSVMAGLDLIMPPSGDTVKRLKEGLADGRLTQAQVNVESERVLSFAIKKRPEESSGYDRARQHAIARSLAASGTVLLKNDGATLPVSPKKYKKVACIGGFAENPIINGQGSAEVYAGEAHKDSPLSELKALLPEVEFSYSEVFNKSTQSGTMLWPCVNMRECIGDAELALFFIGAMEGDETEQFDRCSAQLNPAYGYFIRQAKSLGKKVAVVLQTGSAVILGDWYKSVDAIVEMWYGGEAAGGAVADILCGAVNPSGKLTETFPAKMRTDTGSVETLKLSYDEKLDVGYRYYDRHTDEIAFPFGHGLSYTDFEYSDFGAEIKESVLEISFSIKNIGEADGHEVAQIYIANPTSTVTRPVKELKAFEKPFLKAGSAKQLTVSIPIAELGYYNTALHDWVTESGEYDILIGSSSQDIRLFGSVMYENPAMPYSLSPTGKTTVG